MVDHSKIRHQFTKEGFAELSVSKTPESVLWSPDLLFSKDGYTFPVLVKTNDAIPPAFLSRIAQIKDQKIKPVIIFCQKPKPKDRKRTEESLLSLGISSGYFLNGKLTDLQIKKKISPQAKKELRKLNSIDVFISSKQNIKTRKYIRGRLYFLRDTESYPFFARLIEYEKHPSDKLEEYIDEVMEQCEWIVVLLEDEYSKITFYELKRAIGTMNHNNIFVFVKETKKCKTTWNHALELLKTSTSVTYLSYSNRPDLEIIFCSAVKKRMRQICKQKKIKIPI